MSHGNLCPILRALCEGWESTNPYRSSISRSSSTVSLWCAAVRLRMLASVPVLIGSCQGMTSWFSPSRRVVTRMRTPYYRIASQPKTLRALTRRGPSMSRGSFIVARQLHTASIYSRMKCSRIIFGASAASSK